jgi:hypothetical protein
MGHCGATELREVTAGTTSPAANRLAVWDTPATLMPLPVPTAIAVPLVPVPLVPVPRVPVPVLTTVPASALTVGCRGECGAMYRATGDRDERSGAVMPPSAAFLSATQRV